MTDTITTLEQLTEATSLADTDITHVQTGTPGLRLDQYAKPPAVAMRVAKDIGLYAVQAQRGASLAINNNSDTVLTFDAAGFNSLGMVNIATQPTRITILKVGLYLIEARVLWPSNATGIRSLRARVNGSTIITGQICPAVADTTHNWTHIALPTLLALNDYLEFIVYQNSGAILTIPALSIIANAALLSDPP